MLCIVYFRVPVLSSHGVGVTVTQRRRESDVSGRRQHESAESISETDSRLALTHSCAQVTFIVVVAAL